MDTKEDLVRQRLERERLAKEEYERKRVENEANELERNLQKRTALFDAIDEEAERIFKALETADWSQAELVTFRVNKKHWWSWRKTRDYALFILTQEGIYSVYALRSDGYLYLYDGIWRRPADRYRATYYIRKQLTDLEAHLARLRHWTPEEARPDF